MRIAAIVVNWNGGDENLDCVEALLEQGTALERVYFVDNGSTNGSAERIALAFPDVTLIVNDANLGFGGGNNIGMAAALADGAEAILIVNNDVVMPADTVAHLAEVLEQEPEIGIVGPRVLYRPDPTRVWAAGGTLTWRQNLTTLRGHGARDGERWRTAEDVDYVAGCCLLVRASVLREIGDFDSDYFAYTEDVDFCLRAAEAGYRTRCQGSVAVYHAPSSATGGGYNPRRKYMMGVNSVWFMRAYAQPQDWCKFILFDVLTLPIVWLFGLFSGRGKAVLAKALGILDGLRGRRITAEVMRPGYSRLW